MVHCTFLKFEELKKSFLKAFSLFLILLSPLFMKAQSDLPSWNSKQMKISSDFKPREISNIFAHGAVTYEDLQSTAKHIPYIKDEIVLAIEHNMEPRLAEEHFRAMSWSKYLPGISANFKSVVLTNKTNGKYVSLVHLKLPAVSDVMDVAGKIPFTNGLLWVSPDFYYDGDPREYTPNDTLYSSQYHHIKMQNNLAWDITKGNPNIVVAVTDDGVQLQHHDLSQNIWVNSDEIPGDGIDNDGNGYIDDVYGWDFSFNNNNPDPNHSNDSHGTHVGGIVAARIDNITGVAGVAGLSKVMPIQFYGTGGANWTSTLIAASFAYAVTNGAKILNCSYNVDGFATSPVFIAGAQHLLDNGVLYFNSAGNNNQLNPPRQVVTQGLFVTSTTSTDTRSSFSNYGEGMDVAAPGSGILSTVLYNSYEFYNGTSMSTPNAAGAAALIWGANPTWNVYQIAAQLLGTADDISAQNSSIPGTMGSGRVNTYKGLTVTLPAPKVKSLTGLPNTTVLENAAPTNFKLSYNQVMDPVSVNSIGNIELRNAGPNNIFYDSDDVLFAITSDAEYRVGTNAINYTINEPLTCGNYRLSIISNGVKNPFNTPLDGNGDGTGGDNYVKEFQVAQIYYPDNDGDGYGVAANSITGSCYSTPAGYANVAGDCDDNDANVNPGKPEVCNGIDDNCDGMSDLVLINTNGVIFENPAAIAMSTAAAPANLYPSPITVSGITDSVVKVSVRLKNLSHTWINDVDILLVSPLGDKMVIFSDMGANAVRLENVTITLDDDAENTLSTSTPSFSSGSYKPANSSAETFPLPAPAQPYSHPAPQGTATFRGVFGGKDPNGVWNLYVYDDAGGDAGSIANGWEIIFHTVETICTDDIPTPVVNVTQPTCGSGLGSIEVASPLDPSYTYSIGGPYQSSPLFNSLPAGVYSVTVKQNDEVSDPVEVVLVDAAGVPATPGNIRGSVNVCPYIGTATLVSFNVEEVPGATTYTWTLPSTVTLVSGQGTNMIQVTVNANFYNSYDRTIRVVASNVCGVSGSRSVTLKAQKPVEPRAIVASSTDVCSSLGSGTPITLTINKVLGASSYNWVMDMSGVASMVHPNGSGENDTVVVITFTNAFTTRLLQVNAQNDCGVSNFRSISLHRNALSIPAVISGPVNVCEFIGNGSPRATFSVPTSPNVSYVWDIPAGSTNVTNSNNEISFNFSDDFTGGRIELRATSACGMSAPRFHNLSVITPRAPSGIDVTFISTCPNRIIEYAIDPISHTSAVLVWSVPDGATIISGQNTSTIRVSYPSTAISGNVSVFAQSNCGNSSTRVLKIKMAACSPNQSEMVEMFVNLFPNPALGSANIIALSNEQNKPVNIRILNVQGKIVESFKTTANTYMAFGEKLLPGVYFIEVSQGKKKEIRKFIRF